MVINSINRCEIAYAISVWYGFENYIFKLVKRMKRTEETKPVKYKEKLLQDDSMVKALMEGLAEGVVAINSESKK